MIDCYGRAIQYLRISVTDRCNLRCRYCLPEKGVRLKPREEILRLEEIVAIVRCGLSLGINRLRLTGGEPLVRRDIVSLVAHLAELPGLADLALTTNGQLLGRLAAELKAAGLQRLNISLDTLRPSRYTAISRGGQLEKVLAGMAAAEAAGFASLKLNVVLIPGFNEDEAEDFVRLSLERPLTVRFIELMPVGAAAGLTLDAAATCSAEPAEHFLGRTVGDSVLNGNDRNPAGINTVSNRQHEITGPESQAILRKNASGRVNLTPMRTLKERLCHQYGLLPAEGVIGNGPASYFYRPGSPGIIGFIAALSESFCSSCNRVRLTADGFLRPCLQQGPEIDVKTPLRGGANPEELARLFVRAIAAKPREHVAGTDWWSNQERSMADIGG